MVRDKVAALLVVVLLLLQPPSQVQMTKNFTADVMLFAEVWNRSYCRPIETLVDILSEFPHEAEHIFKPSCVSLRRCGGCCGDERLDCVPVEMHVAVLQVVRVSPVQGKSREEAMSFTEHWSCECRPRRKRLKGQRRPKALHLRGPAGRAKEASGPPPSPPAPGWHLLPHQPQHRGSGCKQIAHRCRKPRHKERKDGTDA